MAQIHIGLPGEENNPALNPRKKESMKALSHNGKKLNYDAASYQEINFDELLDLCIDSKASDLHLAENERIAIRVNGKIAFIENVPKLTKIQAEKLIFGMIKNPLHRERLEQTRELDFAYQHKDNTNFRVNVFFKRHCLGSVLRIVGQKAPSLQELGIPPIMEEMIKQKQGLILVTGPTGSGKSTTMQAMLEYINESRVEHILTIEDPIEFIFEPKKSIFSQREVGDDTLSFSNALRAVLREDPNIVMIGEMRDPETITAAMNLAETGHLVISTLHTSGGPQTIHRLVNAFPIEHHTQIQSRLSDTLIGVLSQRLIPRLNQECRIAIFECMVINAAVRNIIRTGEFAQLYNAMLSGRQDGMITMQDYAYNLAKKGIVNEKDFINFFRQE